MKALASFTVQFGKIMISAHKEKGATMTRTEAIDKLKEIRSMIPEDPANVQIMLMAEIDDVIQVSDLHRNEDMLNVLWTDGHATGFAHAMEAQRIPPLDDPDRCHDFHIAKYVLMEYALNAIRKGEHGHDAD